MSPFETTPAPETAHPIARAVATTSPGRPKWLTTMASTSLAVALLWIFLAGLIVLLGYMVDVLSARNPEALREAGITVDLLAHLNLVAAISLFSGLWLLVAAVTAYACRPITRHLHNALAIFRIVLMVALIVGTSNMAPPTNLALPGAEMLSGPLMIALIAGMELLYPVAILIVFNRKKWRDELVAIRRASA